MANEMNIDDGEFWGWILDSSNALGGIPSAEIAEADATIMKEQPPSTRRKIEGHHTSTIAQTQQITTGDPPPLTFSGDLFSNGSNTTFELTSLEVFPFLEFDLDSPQQSAEKAGEVAQNAMAKTSAADDAVRHAEQILAKKTGEEKMEKDKKETKEKKGKSVNMSRERKKAKKIELQEKLSELKQEHVALEKQLLVEASKHVTLKEEYLNLVQMINSLKNLDLIVSKTKDLSIHSKLGANNDSNSTYNHNSRAPSPPK